MMSRHHGAIVEAATRHRLNPALLLALVQIESSGNTYAYNPEPKYRYLWNVRLGKPFRALTDMEISQEVPPLDFPTLAGDRDQEFWAQQASWGLMQVMGAVAREAGFKGEYLTELTEPSVGLEYGCLHLKSQLRWAGNSVERALAAYNGGHSGNVVAPYRNAGYAAKVLNVMNVLKV